MYNAESEGEDVRVVDGCVAHLSGTMDGNCITHRKAVKFLFCFFFFFFKHDFMLCVNVAESEDFEFSRDFGKIL